MVLLKADVNPDIIKYVDSLIDNQILMNRTDALRQIVIDHRDKIKRLK